MISLKDLIMKIEEIKKQINLLEKEDKYDLKNWGL